YGLQQLEQNKEALKQAAVADVLLVTKTDLAESSQIEALQQKLSAINASATQHRIQHGKVDPQWIVDVGLFDAATKKAQPLRWLRAPTKSQLL
ncbi:MAG: GTP-binding protein, partial [Methylotenera sp.]